MPLFGGPSDYVLLTTARGIAGEYASLAFLTTTLGPGDDLLDSVKKDRAAQGLPNSADEVAQMASDVIRQYELGWFKRNRFLGMIEGSLRAMGVDRQDARYLKGLVEIYWHKKNYISARQEATITTSTNSRSDLLDPSKQKPLKTRARMSSWTRFFRATIPRFQRGGNSPTNA